MKETGLKRLRIFAASPSDMASERAKVETVISAFKPLADNLGIMVETIDWRMVIPNAGRPEQIILDQLKPETWDTFIGVLWHRFGTQTGERNFQTQKEYLSGTEEEFHIAYRLWKQTNKPRIMMYRCTRPFPFEIDPDQLKRVNEFFQLIEDPKSDYRLLTYKFDTTEAFERLLIDHLQKLLLEYDTAIHGKPVSPEIIQMLAPPRVLETLPRRTPFFGRKREIEQAMRALSPDDRGWGVVIDGIGGIGKTSLAIEVAYICKIEGKFDVCIFVSSKRDKLEPSGIKETKASTTLDELLNDTTRAIGRHGITNLSGKDKQRVLLDALRGMRTLIIFDNLETLTTQDQTEIADFLRDLPVECKAIITSRRRTSESAFTIRLERLDWDAARELIESEMNRHPDVKRILTREGESGWKQLYDQAGGSPLAITWMLGLIRARGLRFKDALSILRDGGAESDLNSFIFKQAQERMDANEQLTLDALSFFGNSASFNSLMAASGLNHRQLDMVLERLRALSLVDVLESSDESERFTLHPLTKHFVHTSLKNEVNRERVIGMRFALYWINYVKQYGGFDEGYAPFDRLETEWENIYAAENWLWEKANLSNNIIGDKPVAQEFINLAPAIWKFLAFSGRWEESIQIDMRIYEISMLLNRKGLAGRSAYYVARNYYYRMQIREAQSWSQKCEEAWSTSQNKYDQCDLSLLKGHIALQNAQYSNSEKNYKDALGLAESSNNHKKKATALNALGRLYYDRKKYKTAKKYYTDALDLARKIKDKERQASYAGNLGRLAIDQAQWEDAIKWYDFAVPLAKETRAVSTIAGLQYGLALAWEAMGQVETALNLAVDSLKIYKQIEHMNVGIVQELVDRLKKAKNK